MEGESDCDIVKSVGELLRNGQTSEVLKVFNDNELIVKCSAWDLIPLVSEHLTTQCENTKPEVFNCSEKLMNIIADSSNPEEALLQLIEEIEECEDSTKFLALLLPIKKILFRIPEKRLISFAWGFNAIQSFLDKCEIPECNDLVGKEKLLLDNEEKTSKITFLCKQVVTFYDTFEVPLNEGASDKICVLRKFLVRLLGKPLLYVDMEIFDGIKSKGRLIVECLVHKIFQTTNDIIMLLNSRFETENADLFKLNSLGLASLFYLVYTEGILLERVPKVYSPIHLFQSSLYLVTDLIETNHQIVIEKGLAFVATLLEHVKFLKLSYLLLDSVDHSKFCKTITKVIVYNESKHVRQSALNVYKTYLLSFEIQGIYLLIFNLMSFLNHSGLISFTITMYKDLLVEEFLKRENNNFSVYLKGHKLLALLRKFCFLHKKEESDLIELSDQIIAILNLLRYLSLRDINNVTHIWDHFNILEEEYFRPLRKGIDLSRAHYELKVREITEEVAGNTAKSESDPNISIVVAGQSLTSMPKTEKLQVLNSSLTAFDIMDSLLSRLIECIEAKKAR